MNFMSKYTFQNNTSRRKKQTYEQTNKHKKHFCEYLFLTVLCFYFGVGKKNRVHS